jgi:hypothetical protein
LYSASLALAESILERITSDFPQAQKSPYKIRIKQIGRQEFVIFKDQEIANTQEILMPTLVSPHNKM